MSRENTQQTVISQQKLVSHKLVSNSNRPVMGGLMPLRLTEARPGPRLDEAQRLRFWRLSRFLRKSSLMSKQKPELNVAYGKQSAYRVSHSKNASELIGRKRSNNME